MRAVTLKSKKSDSQECLSHSGKTAHRQECLCYLLDGLGLRNVSEKVENASLEFGGLEADGGGVEGAGDFPELFGAASGGVDELGVAAGEGFVFFVADEEDRERCVRRRLFLGRLPRRGGWLIFRRDQRSIQLKGRKSVLPRSGERRRPSVIERGFAQVGEGRFSDDSFDAGIDRGGLQRDARAHGFAEGEEMWRRGRGG